METSVTRSAKIKSALASVAQNTISLPFSTPAQSGGRARLPSGSVATVPCLFNLEQCLPRGCLSRGLLAAALAFAERIVVLEGGRITAAGPHAGLMETSDYYARTYRLQEIEEGRDAA